MLERMLAHSAEGQLARLGWSSWNLAPSVLLGVSAFVLVYCRGLSALRVRGAGARLRVTPKHAACYFAGILAILIALVSPVDSFSDALAWVHMLQHTLLMMVAAPLVAIGAPGYVALWAFKPPRSMAWIPRLSRWARPIVAWVLYSVTLWIWHIPALYEAALSDAQVHDAQHLAFFFASYLFWRVLLEPYVLGRIQPVAGVVYLFVASLHAMILGALMTLSPEVWYRTYIGRSEFYGWTALQDQQIAGAIMWMPAGIAYVAAAVLLLARFLKEPDRAGEAG